MIKIDKDLSIKDVVANLEDMKNLSKKEFRHTYDLAIDLLSRCRSCCGSGYVETDQKPSSGYKVKFSPRGVRIYLVVCFTCGGSGKQLDVQCRSCGQSAAIMPDQKHIYTYCRKCEERLRLEGKVV